MKCLIRTPQTASTQSQRPPRPLRDALLTTVGVNEFGLSKAHSEVVEHRGLVQVAEGREVVLAHEDVRVAEWRQTLGIDAIVQLLRTKKKLKMFGVSADPLSLSSLPDSE